MRAMADHLSVLLAGFVVLASVAWLSGCDGDSGHPDTGYGVDQAVPTSVTCSSLCARSADCLGHLCAEDTGNDLYLSVSDPFAEDCERSCSEATLQSKLTSDRWQCFFTQSCRSVFERDVCHAQANYHCQ